MAERGPLPSLLRRDTFERARVERIWGAIASARAARRAPARQIRALGIGVSLTVAAALGASVLFASFEAPVSTPEARHASRSTPLSLTRSDGAAFERVEASAAVPERVALSDGSSLEVRPGGLVSAVELSAKRVVLRLQRGQARFSVRPGGPRRWVVDAGAARVEVVGTRFEVTRIGEATRVRVEEGKVLVHGAGLRDGMAQLTAGQELTVGPSGAPADVAREPTVAAPGPDAPQPQPPRAGPPVTQATPGARAQDAAHGTTTSEPMPSRAEPTSLEDELAEADRLRVAHQHAAAARVLERAVLRHASDPRAAIAAFTLGRVREHALRDALGAANAYARALSLGLSGTLAQDARAHLARALLRARQPAAAAAAARDYLAHHPEGADSASMRSVLLQAAGSKATDAAR